VVSRLQKLKSEMVSCLHRLKLEVVSRLQKLKSEMVSCLHRLKLEVVSNLQKLDLEVVSRLPKLRPKTASLLHKLKPGCGFSPAETDARSDFSFAGAQAAIALSPAEVQAEAFSQQGPSLQRRNASSPPLANGGEKTVGAYVFRLEPFGTRRPHRD